MAEVIVLVSGGIDSCVLCSVAAQEDQLALLHVDYHQRAREKERNAFEKFCLAFKPKHRLIAELPYFEQLGGCALVDRKQSVEAFTELGTTQLPRTYLPFGLPAFWSVAAAWAQVIGAQRIYCGGAEDYDVQLPAYAKLEPAIDGEAVQAFNYLLQKVVRPGQKIDFQMPFYNLTRAEILKLANQLSTPLELTWSCLEGGANPCQQCYRCLVRRNGFRSASMIDPVRES
jgi:7-cyano-7-deazaguanine synthase